MTIEHRVLAQKYRSSRLKEIIGQDILVATLSNAIQTHQLPSAFVFTGIRGTGKTSTARIIALSLNCLNKPTEALGTLEPCLTCSACIAIQEGRHIDVIEMDAASHTGVDDIREIIEASKYRPLQAAYKIYIIDEAHMLSKSAFNALLKTLEEPPPHVKFILATTEIRKIPATVLSRCMRFDLQRIPLSILQDHYKQIVTKEGANITDGALALIAQCAEGSARDGLSLLEQALHLNASPIDEDAVRFMLGRASKQSIEKLFDLLLQGNIPDALTQARQLYKDGIEAESLLQSLLECVHQTSLYKVNTVSEAENSFFTVLASKTSLAVLTRFWQIILKGLEEIKLSPMAFMAAEMIFIRLGYVKDLPPLDHLFSKNTPQINTVETSTPGTNSLESSVKISPQIPLTASESIKIPNRFDDLVQMIANAREPLLYTHLLQDVQVVSYVPGHLIINIADDVSPYFSKDLKKFLETFTKTSWVIETSHKQGNSTLKVQQQDALNQEIERCKQDKLVQKTLDLFPGSIIQDVLLNTSTTKTIVLN